MFYSYVSEPIKPIGNVMVSCKNLNINHKARDLKLCVMEKEKGKQCSPNLGRSWLNNLYTNLGRIVKNDMYSVKHTKLIPEFPIAVEKVLNDFPSVFSGKLGLLNKRKFELHLKDEAKTSYFKPRVVTYALKN